MKRLMSTFCVAAACFVAAAGVQSASASAGQAEKKMDTPVTVTGCVAAGAVAGQYTFDQCDPGSVRSGQDAAAGGGQDERPRDVLHAQGG